MITWLISLWITCAFFLPIVLPMAFFQAHAADVESPLKWTAVAGLATVFGLILGGFIVLGILAGIWYDRR